MTANATDIAAPAAAHILVVDDDHEIRDLIRVYLSDEGFRVSVAADGREMRSVFERDAPELVLLDVKLPGENGLALAAELRAQADVGILMLSQKDGLVDKVAGLEVGADDYLPKPFHLRELLARVRSILRRRDPVPVADIAAERGNAPILRFGSWKVDPDARELCGSDDVRADLSSGEFDLLMAFLEHPNRPLSRDFLLDLVSGRDAALFDRSIDVQIGRLRRKIESNPRRPALIKTVRGVGYMLAADVRRG